MKHAKTPAVLATLAAAFGFVTSAQADVVLTTFDDFYSDQLYNSWATPNAVIESGTTNYVITATGYGSNWKYLPANGAGNTTIELTVTLSGPAAADGHLGPIVGLVDADGTYANFAWYGQTLGRHVLTMALASPTWFSAPGTTPGFDLATLSHLHIQLDPGGFGTQGAYTISWEHLRLVGPPAPPIQISAPVFNPATREFTLTWSSINGKSYRVLHAGTVNGTYSALVSDIASGGTSTTATVPMPVGDAGYLRVEEQ